MEDVDFFLIPFVLVFFLDLGNAYNDKSYNDYKDLQIY